MSFNRNELIDHVRQVAVFDKDGRIAHENGAGAFVDMLRLYSTTTGLTLLKDSLYDHLRNVNFNVVIGNGPKSLLPGSLIVTRFATEGKHIRLAQRRTMGGRFPSLGGILKPGDVFCVIEDLTTTGKTSLDLIDELRQNGYNVSAFVPVIDMNTGKLRSYVKHRGVAYLPLVAANEIGITNPYNGKEGDLHEYGSGNTEGSTRVENTGNGNGVGGQHPVAEVSTA